MLDQGDVRLFLRMLNVIELLSHQEKVSRHLTGVHQKYSPAGSRQILSLLMCEHVHRCVQEKMQTGCCAGGCA